MDVLSVEATLEVIKRISKQMLDRPASSDSDGPNEVFLARVCLIATQISGEDMSTNHRASSPHVVGEEDLKVLTGKLGRKVNRVFIGDPLLQSSIVNGKHGCEEVTPSCKTIARGPVQHVLNLFPG